jgi:hypothetical protein
MRTPIGHYAAANPAGSDPTHRVIDQSLHTYSPPRCSDNTHTSAIGLRVSDQSPWTVTDAIMASDPSYQVRTLSTGRLQLFAVSQSFRARRMSSSAQRL